MSDNVHVDYKSIMKDRVIDFTIVYENAVRKIEARYAVPPKLAEKIHAKREFGIKKYGELSFQGSFTNAMTVPIYDHLEEELIDSINYALHIEFQAIFDEIDEGYGDELLTKLLDLYKLVDKIKAQKRADNGVFS
jgi:hypothetical protein